MKDRTLAILVVVAGCLIVASGAIQSTSSASQDPATPPFDPLSETEEQQAIEIAQSNDTVTERLGVRTETIGAAVRTEKVAGPLSEMPRMADVWFYNYVTDEPVWAVVNLDEGRVLRLVDATNYDPPLTEGEIREAGELASLHPNVTTELAGNEVQEWLGYRWNGGDAGTCDVNRCLLVAPVIDDGVAHFLVRVNLSQGVVDGLVHRSSITEEGIP